MVVSLKEWGEARGIKEARDAAHKHLFNTQDSLITKNFFSRMSIVQSLRNLGLLRYYCLLSRNKGSVPYIASRKGGHQMLFACLRIVRALP